MDWLKRLIRKIRATVVWNQVVRHLRSQVIPVRDMENVKTFLFTGMRARTPDYAFESQQPQYYFPNLTAKAWHPNSFADEAVRQLEENYEAIKQEYRLAKGQLQLSSQSDQLSTEDSWKVLNLFILGHQFTENCALFPTTTSVIESIPGATTAGNVLFSRLAPRANIHAHFGPVNTRIRVHLGIEVPAGCEIEIDNQTRTWEEGKCIVFDDSFLHSVRNTSDRHRVILLVDVWHPELRDDEIAALMEIDEYSGRKRQILEKLGLS